jgi:endo-1,4-beta-xylanase
VTINIASSLFRAKTVAAASQTVSTTGFTWAAGQLVYSNYGIGAGVGLTSLAGDVDDVAVSPRKASVTANNSRLYIDEMVINGVGLDANFVYGQSTSRRSTAALLAFSETAGPDADASNFAKTSSSGASGVPAAPGFTAQAAGCLVVAVANAIGSHVTNPPAAPAGYTLVGQVSSETSNAPSNTTYNTIAVAVRNTLTTAGELVAAATFTGWSDIGIQLWSTCHYAMAPVAAGFVNATGSAAGAGAAAGVFAADFRASGAAAGTSAAAGAGASEGRATGSAAGLATATGAAAKNQNATGSSAGVAAATGVGAAEGRATGAAAGVTAVTGVGRYNFASAGSSAGVGGATGVTGAGTGTGSAAGVATVAGVARWEQRASGTSAGVATATGASSTGAIGDPDLAHAIHANLVMFVGSHPAGAAELGKERVAGGGLTLFGGAALTASHPDIAWKALITNGGASGAWTALTNQIKSITGDFTLWADLVFNNAGNAGHILCVPWDLAAGWTSPYTVFDWVRNGSTTTARWQFTPSSTLVQVNDTAGNTFPTALVRKRLWVRRSGTTVTFGVGGTLIGTRTGQSSAAPNWAAVATANQIVLGTQKADIGGATREALGATYLRLMMWNRALADADFASLDANPMLGLVTVAPSASAGAGTASGTSSVQGVTPAVAVTDFSRASGLYGGAALGEMGLGEGAFTAPAVAAVATGQAAGGAAVNGAGASTFNATGVSAGTSTAAGVARFEAAGAGSAAGVSTVNGVGKYGVLGQAAGVAAVDGRSLIAALAAGSSAGAATVNGQTVFGVPAQGSAAGTSTASGVGLASFPSTGSATGVTTLAGVGARNALLVGTAAGVATVAAKGPRLAAAAIARGGRISAGMRNWTVFSGTPGLQALVEYEYNSLMPGNAFKWDSTEPSQGTFDFTQADLFVGWADARSMPVRLHTLVWHNQLPAWVPTALNSSTWQGIFDVHIAGVLGHYPGRTWDVEVVNEAFRPTDGNPGGFRTNLFYTAALPTGSSYITYALTKARAAAATARLFISDFDVEQSGEDQKRADILAAITTWKGAGVPLDGFSIQGHLQPATPLDKPALRAFVRGLRQLGLAIVVSELDFRNISDLGLTDAAAFAAIRDYAQQFLDVLLDEGGDTVVTWGVAPEDWVQTGVEQIASVPFAASPFAITPLFNGIDTALKGRVARTTGQAGVAGASLVGTATGTVIGSSTVAGAARWDFRATGTAAGGATVSGTGDVGRSTGAAAGTSTVAGQARAEQRAVGSAAGTSNAGAATQLGSSGIAAGTSAVAGVAVLSANLTGSAAGTSSVAGIGAAFANLTGSAAGHATVQAFTDAARATGSAAGQAAASGVTDTRVLATGQAAGVATVNGQVAATARAVGTLHGQGNLIAVSKQPEIRRLGRLVWHRKAQTRVRWAA